MRVAQLWRFPVKSLGGEQLDGAEVDDRGIVGDRRWGLLDVATGHVLTARRAPQLLFASARWLDGGVEIRSDTGAALGGDDALSAWLGREVRLVPAGEGVRGTYETPVDFEHERDSEWVAWEGPEGTFHDSRRTQVSLASLPTMGAWDVRRFRINVVLDGGDDDELLGTSLRLGTVEAEVVKKIDRCVVTTRPQPGLERDLDVLRAINRRRGGDLGVGALVRVPGAVAVGDAVEVSRSSSSRPPRSSSGR